MIKTSLKKTVCILSACLLAGLSTACGNSAGSGGSPTFKVGEYHAKAGDQHFPVTIEVENSPGFSLLGLRLFYDEALKPCKTSDKLNYEYKEGAMCENMMVTCLVSDFDTDHVSFAGIASDTPKGSGNLITFYFKIPADAEPGTKYELTPETATVADADSNDLTAKVVPGYIVVDAEK